MERARNRNKAVRCNICSKCMRSDHLKRHMQKHKDILSMTDDEAKEELRARHTAQMHREERRREIEEIALQEEIPIDSDSPERYYWNEGMQHNASSWDADKYPLKNLIRDPLRFPRSPPPPIRAFWNSHCSRTIEPLFSRKNAPPLRRLGTSESPTFAPTLHIAPTSPTK